MPAFSPFKALIFAIFCAFLIHPAALAQEEATLEITDAKIVSKKEAKATALVPAQKDDDPNVNEINITEIGKLPPELRGMLVEYTKNFITQFMMDAQLFAKGLIDFNYSSAFRRMNDFAKYQKQQVGFKNIELRYRVGATSVEDNFQKMRELCLAKDCQILESKLVSDFDYPTLSMVFFINYEHEAEVFKKFESINGRPIRRQEKKSAGLLENFNFIKIEFDEKSTLLARLYQLQENASGFSLSEQRELDAEIESAKKDLKFLNSNIQYIKKASQMSRFEVRLIPVDRSFWAELKFNLFSGLLTFIEWLKYIIPLLITIVLFYIIKGILFSLKDLLLGFFKNSGGSKNGGGNSEIYYTSEPSNTKYVPIDVNPAPKKAEKEVQETSAQTSIQKNEEGAESIENSDVQPMSKDEFFEKTMAAPQEQTSQGLDFLKPIPDDSSLSEPQNGVTQITDETDLQTHFLNQQPPAGAVDILSSVKKENSDDDSNKKPLQFNINKLPPKE